MIITDRRMVLEGPETNCEARSDDGCVWYVSGRKEPYTRNQALTALTIEELREANEDPWLIAQLEQELTE